MHVILRPFGDEYQYVDTLWCVEEQFQFIAHCVTSHYILTIILKPEGFMLLRKVMMGLTCDKYGGKSVNVLLCVHLEEWE